MGIINKKIISTNSLQESFFREIGKPLDNNCSIDYKGGVIELGTYYPTNAAGKNVFHINFFQLDMDIWEENGYPTALKFNNVYPAHILLLGNHIQNYKFIGNQISLLLNDKQNFINNDLSEVKKLSLFVYPVRMLEDIKNGQPVRKDWIHVYGHRGEDDFFDVKNPFPQNEYRSTILEGLYYGNN